MTEEEAILRNQQFKLGYSEVPLHKCVYTFNQVSASNEVTPNHLDESAEILGLPILSSNTDESITEFYSSLHKQGHTPKRLLIMTAVLLCYGSNTEKIEILFDTYNISTRLCISVSECGLMLEDCFQLAVYELPKLVTYKTSGSDFITMHNYIDMISAVKRQGEVKLFNALTRDDKNISKKDFFKRMAEPPLVRILSATSFRTFLKEEFDNLDGSSKYKVLSRLKV